jgi:hypothetical protein
VSRRMLLGGNLLATITRAAGCETSPARRAAAADVDI